MMVAIVNLLDATDTVIAAQAMTRDRGGYSNPLTIIGISLYRPLEA